MAGPATIELTDANFSTTIEGSTGVAMVDFWAAWCGPCRLVGPFVDQIATEYQDQGVLVGKVDVDQNPRITAQFGVRSIPSILFFKDGKLVDQVVGAVPKVQLENKIQQHMG
jgi:thioredoxin 1